MKRFLLTIVLTISSLLLLAQHTWDKKNSGIADATLCDIEFIGDSIGYIVGYSPTKSVILKTTDAGETWTNVTTPSVTTELLSCNFLDKDLGYVVGRNGGLYKTENGGAVWQKINIGSNVNLTDVSFPSQNIGYLCSDGGRFFKSENNGGLGWLTKSIYTADDFIAVQFFNQNTGVISATSGRIWKTNNGGTSWDTINEGWNNINNSFFCTENVGYIIGRGLVKRSIDGGNHWTNISPAAYPSTYFYSIYFTFVQSGFIGGKHELILTTNDGGSSWEIENSGGTETIKQIIFTPYGNGFAVGTNGLILKREVPDGIEDTKLKSDISIYPNPSKGTFVLNSNSKKELDINIFNPNGTIIFSEKNINSQIEFNLNEYSRGIYFVQIISDNEVITKKLILK
ncbi:MAG: YCF48-related protein [Bacteroidota bacterium]|nr:YCF48-related protein [Bacteroidota bacterium]